MTLLDPNFNGLPPVTDWEKVFIALQQANEKVFRGASAKEFGKQVIGDIAIQGADFEDLPIATSSAPVVLPIPQAEMKFGFLANGRYTQPNGPDLVYTDVQWGLTLFDGDKWIKKFTLTIPQGKDGRDVADWEAKAYSYSSAVPKVSFLVFYQGKIYENNAATLAVDIPGSSSKWVEKVGGAKVIDNVTSTSVTEAVSANQARILNEKKVEVTKFSFIPSTNVFNFKDKTQYTTGQYIVANGTITPNANGIITGKVYLNGYTRFWFDTGSNNAQPLYANYYNDSNVIISTVALRTAGGAAGYKIAPEGATYFIATLRSQAGEVVDLSKIVIRFSEVLGPTDETIEYVTEFSGGYNPVGLGFEPGFNKLNPNRFWNGYLNGYLPSDPTSANLSLNPNGITSDFIYCEGQAKIYLLKSIASLGGGTVVFYNKFLAPIGSAPLFVAGALKGNAIVLSGATMLRATVHRKVNASDPNEDLSKVVLSFSEINELVPFKLEVTAINGYKFKIPTASALSEYLVNKTIAYMGDSIVKGGYPAFIGQYLGMKVINLAYDGCRWVNETTTKIDFSDVPSAAGANVIQNQVYRLLRMVTPTNVVVPETSALDEYSGGFSYPTNGLGTLNKADLRVIVIHCGTNDAGNAKPKGTFSAVDNLLYTAVDKKTMWGAIKWAIVVLRKHFPDAELILATPLQRSDLERPVFFEYVTVVKEASEMFSLKCMDMFGMLGINRENSMTYLFDGLHPTTAGHMFIAKKAATYIFNEVRF